jgi:carboxyl-terminal processing protease
MLRPARRLKARRLRLLFSVAAFAFLGDFRVKKRFSFVPGVVLSALLALPVFVSAQTGSPNLPAADARGRGSAPVAAARSGRPVTADDVEQDVSAALAVIEQNYVDGQKLDYNAAFKSSIIGMLRTLDPHSNYFDPKEFEEFRTSQRSEYFGIGATIGDLSDGNKVDTVILATFKDAPASKAGLRFGDRIVAVDGQSMRGKHYYETREKLLGPRGTVVKVTVERAATGATETFDITRNAVPQPSVPEAYMIRPGVGYIAMTGGFNLTTADELEDALDRLHAQGMRSLVLDLRGNPGGLLIQAVRAANMFLRRGQLIVSQKGRVKGSEATYVAVNDSPDQTPLVVLVNRGTASAAEILAGALQDHDRATIVGENSFGKGLVQFPFQLPANSAVLLTIAKYYTPSGRLIQREYANEGFYEYYTRGGTLRDEQPRPAQPVGPASRTDSGRTVYGGGGIMPDEAVKPRLVVATQARLNDPVFAFSRELAMGRVAGFESYKVQRPIEYGHVLRADEFPVTDALYAALRQFVVSHPAYKVTGAQLDRDRAYVERQLRYNLANAAYGTYTALQAFNADDPQVARGVELLQRPGSLTAQGTTDAQTPQGARP